MARRALLLPWLAGCVPDDGWITAPVPRGPAVELSEPVACADPASREEAPFDRVELGEPPPLDAAEMEGAGMVVADLDGDGIDDLFVPGAGGG